MKTNLNINLTTIIVVIMSILGIGYLMNRNSNLNEELTEQRNLANAFLDSTRTYRNYNDELVSERLTLQATIEELRSDNWDLSESQKELLRRVEGLSEDKEIINAALIRSKSVIDSLLNEMGKIDEEAETVHFSKEGKHLSYNILVGNVIPSQKNPSPFLLIKNLEMPNEIFVEFHWRTDEKDLYPVEFSITNSNPYVKTIGVDSYAIPQLKKPDVNPSNWMKIKDFLKDNGRYIGAFAIGAAAGGIIF